MGRWRDAGLAARESPREAGRAAARGSVRGPGNARAYLREQSRRHLCQLPLIYVCVCYLTRYGRGIRARVGFMF